MFKKALGWFKGLEWWGKGLIIIDFKSNLAEG